MPPEQELLKLIVAHVKSFQRMDFRFLQREYEKLSHTHRHCLTNENTDGFALEPGYLG